MGVVISTTTQLLGYRRCGHHTELHQVTLGNQLATPPYTCTSWTNMGVVISTTTHLLGYHRCGHLKELHQAPL